MFDCSYRVNNQTGEEINNQRGGPDNRGKRYGCAHRDRPIEESITEFRAMRDGKSAMRWRVLLTRCVRLSSVNRVSLTTGCWSSWT